MSILDYKSIIHKNKYIKSSDINNKILGVLKTVEETKPIELDSKIPDMQKVNNVVSKFLSNVNTVFSPDQTPVYIFQNMYPGKTFTKTTDLKQIDLVSSGITSIDGISQFQKEFPAYTGAIYTHTDDTSCVFFSEGDQKHEIMIDVFDSLSGDTFYVIEYLDGTMEGYKNKTINIKSKEHKDEYISTYTQTFNGQTIVISQPFAYSKKRYPVDGYIITKATSLENKIFQQIAINRIFIGRITSTFPTSRDIVIDSISSTTFVISEGSEYLGCTFSYNGTPLLPGTEFKAPDKKITITFSNINSYVNKLIINEIPN